MRTSWRNKQTKIYSCMSNIDSYTNFHSVSKYITNKVSSVHWQRCLYQKHKLCVYRVREANLVPKPAPAHASTPPAQNTNENRLPYLIDTFIDIAVSFWCYHVTFSAINVNVRTVIVLCSVNTCRVSGKLAGRLGTNVWPVNKWATFFFTRYIR